MHYYPTNLKGGDVVQLPDGRIGTICYHGLEGCGGVWGEHDFSHIEQTINNEWPAPQFMLREKEREQSFKTGPGAHIPEMECVGIAYELIRRAEVK